MVSRLQRLIREPRGRHANGFPDPRPHRDSCRQRRYRSARRRRRARDIFLLCPSRGVSCTGGLGWPAGGCAIGPVRTGRRSRALSRFPGCAHAEQRGGSDTEPMPSTLADRPEHSPALRQRLRARARRVSVLRRRVGALTIALLLATFGAISTTGALGKSTGNGAIAHAASAASTDSSSSVSSDGASTTSDSASSTITSSPTTSGPAIAVTTSQS